MFYLLPFDAETLKAYAAARRLHSPGEAAEALARAIAGTPGWERFPGCRLHVNPQVPAVALFGNLDTAQKAELAVQADALAGRCRHFRALSWEEVDCACKELSGRLQTLLESPGWHCARLTAIPRGGLHILDRVSSLLPGVPVLPDLPTDPKAPVIVIDDCAYTGTRFRQFLAGVEGPRIAFATLFSSPHLRHAILQAEPRVRACFSAGDLRPAPMAGCPEVWRQVRAPGYIAEGMEVVCLPWKEPDRAVLHPETHRPIPAWRLVPSATPSPTDLPVDIVKYPVAPA